jgi:alpha-D-xyloside xylohydrolase
MKKIFAILAITVSLAARLCAQQEAVHIPIGPSTLDVRFVTPTILHVRISPDGRCSPAQSLIVTAVPEKVAAKKTVSEGTITLSTQRAAAVIHLRTGAIDVLDAAGKKILAVAGPDTGSFVKRSIDGVTAYAIRQRYTITPDEALYGLGQFEDKVMNFRNHEVLIAQANRIAINPFLVSTNGYGILWDNYSMSRFADNANGMSFGSDAADAIDYYVVVSPSMDDAIAGYRTLTGAAPLFGKWAYGYWQSKERYLTGSELIATVKEYRRRKIPFDNIIQDWQYWGEGTNFSGMTWDSTRYPHPKAMTDSLHAMHAHLMASIWPAFGSESRIYKEMDAKKILFTLPHWCGGKVYDAYDPAGRSVYWKYVKSGLFDNGVDGYWMDGSEPEFRCTDDRYVTSASIIRNGRCYLGPLEQYLNTYSLMTTKGVYEHQRAASNDHRVFILTRSSFAGQQRYGAVTWSGDTFASWDNLRVQIAAGINFSLSGIPYWNSDIGGFIVDSRFPDGCANDEYRELYVRWFQFGAFCPMFRSHGTSTPREMWRFGDKGEWAYDALVKMDELRYRLMPYIYSTAWRVTNSGYSFIRGLSMDFPRDAATYPIADQFMFGSSLMVNPVTAAFDHPARNAATDITTDHFFSPDGSEAGMDIAMYNGTHFDSLVMKRKTDASGIAWYGCLPAELDTNYCIRIDGCVLSELAGRYTFTVSTDGGMKMWIDTMLVIDDWSNAVPKTYSPTVTFAAATKYRMRIEHAQHRVNSANLKITWVTPSAQAAERSRDVYLPGSSQWFDFWTGKTYGGGRTVKSDAPIDILPLFVPAGSIIPMGPRISYATEGADPIEIRVYPGRDCRFDLYEDENDNYNYEQGKHSIIPFRWNDADKTLTIAARQGTFLGMLKKRTFSIVRVDSTHGTGDETTAVPNNVVLYNGKSRILNLK